MKKMTGLVIFDLDGTLLNTIEDLGTACNHALRMCGCPERNMEEYNMLVGRGIYNLFIGALPEGMKTKEMALRMKEHFIPYYDAHKCDMTRPYPGIPELLANLKADGRTVLLATSKPTVFAERILKHFGLDPWFDGITGSELDGTRVNKWEVIDHALHKAGITDRQTAVMVGDRSHDVIGALKNNIPCIGVLYGYGDLPELQSAKAACIARTVSDLANLLLQSTLT